jgi:mRNA interferase MazF
MPGPCKGEVWMSDLGIAAKVRPCLLLTNEPADDELALFSVVHHTTSLSGNRWELVIPKPFLKDGRVSFSADQYD